MRSRANLLVLLALSISSAALAQWVQTNGPYIEGVTTLAGSGRNLFAGTSYNGIYVSSDSGRTWTSSSAGLEYVYGMATHVPTVSDLEVVGPDLLAATHFAGVYLSTNGGSSWSQSNAGLTSTSVRMLHAAGSSLIAATSDARVFVSTNGGRNWSAGGAGIPPNTYVQCMETLGTKVYAGTSGGVYVSSDGGGNWSSASSGLQYPSGKVGYVLALAAQGPRLIAGLYNGGLFVSTDGGGSWTPTAQGFPPSDAQDFLVRGDTLYAATGGEGVLLSSNQGVTWIPMNEGLADLKVRFLAEYGEKLYAQAELGFYVTPRPGAAWSRSPTPEVSVTSFEAFASDADRLFAVAARNNVFMTTDFGASWTWMGRPVADFHAYCLALTGQTLLIGGTCVYGRVERSLDAGVTWGVALDTSGTPSGSSFNAEALAARGPEVVAGGNGVWRSTDEGATWSQLMSVLPSLNYVWTLAYLDSVLFAGGNYGVYGLWGNDTAWRFAGGGLPSTYVKCLAVRGTTLLAGTWRGGMSRSTDYGASWMPVNEGLTDSSILCLAVAGSRILAGTETKGVFLSTDDGVSWEAVNAGLKGRAIYTLAIHGGYAFAGTGDGNGASRRLLADLVGADPDVDPTPAGFALEQNYPNPFNPRTTIRYALPVTTEVRLTVYDLLGRQVSLLVDGPEDAGTHDVTFDGSGLSSGVYVYRFRAGDYVRSKKLIILR